MSDTRPKAEEEATTGRWLGLAGVLVLLGLLLHSYHELHRPLASYRQATGAVEQPRRRRTTGKNPVWYVEFRLTGQPGPFQLYADSLALLTSLQAVADGYHLTRVYYNQSVFGNDYNVMQLENDRLGGVVYSLYDARKGQTSDFVMFLLLLAIAGPLALRPWLARLAVLFD